MLLTKVKFYRFVVFAFILSCSSSSNQPVPNSEITYNEMNQLADSAYNSCVMGDSVLASDLTFKLIEMANQMEISVAKADAYRTVGMVYNNWMDYQNTFYYYRKAEQILNNIENEQAIILRAKLWLNMSLLYIMGGEYQEAIDYALKGDTIFTKYMLVPYSINAYSKVSEIYERLRNEEKASYYYEKLFELSTKTDDPFGKTTCFLAKGNLCIIQKEYQQAIQWFNKAENVADSVYFLETKINCLLNKSLVLKLINPNDTQIIQLLIASLPFVEELDNPYQETDIYYRIANAYFQINDLEKAYEYIQKAEQLAKFHSITNLQRQNLLLLANIYSSKKMYEKSSQILIELENITQKYYSEQTTKDLLFTNARYEAQTREVKINQLETENELKQAKIENRNMLLMGGSIIIILGVLVAIFWIRFFKQKQFISIQEKKLQAQRILDLEKEKEFIAMQATMKGEETERGRIARDLHDGLGGLLSGVKLSIHHMKDQFIISSEMAQVFNQSISLIDASVQELRRVAHHMMPEILIESGIHGALESYCYSMPELGETNLKYNSFGSQLRWDTGFELAVYRIAQELINNAIKHALASQITVQLLQDEQRICLTVTDDGKGFNVTEKNTDGKGLQGIRSRVASYNGRIDIQSTPNSGTEILVEFDNIKKW